MNFKTRTLWIRDNLEVMIGMNSETVDLIYLDPPFNTKRVWHGAPGSVSEGAVFNDNWNTAKNTNAIDDDNLLALVNLSGKAHSNGMKTYLEFMAPRLVECHRILKPTGSLYLHCDDTADSYLRMSLDVIFGANCRINTITWKRHGSNNAVTRAFGRISDTILFYTKDAKQATFNLQYGELSKAALRRYRYKDKDGRRYRLTTLTATKSPSADDSRRFVWNGAQPSEALVWQNSKEAMDEMYANGRIMFGVTGKAKMPEFKRYLDENPGQKCQSIWTDIKNIGATSKERLGWPTQKPLALLERIISASSNEGDLVFDPFAGCGTTLVAAERLKRNWIGCEISNKAEHVVTSRFDNDVDLNITSELPERTDTRP